MLQLPISEARKAIPSQPVEDTTFDRIRRHKALCEQMVCLWVAEENLIAAARGTNGGQPLREKPVELHEINQKVDALAEERKNVMQSFIDAPPVSAKAASALIFYILEMCEDGELDERGGDCLRGIAGALSADGTI